MDCYLVAMEDTKDGGLRRRTVCKNKSDLSILISNLSEGYRILTIEAIEDCTWDWREFCQINKKIETGGK